MVGRKCCVPNCKSNYNTTSVYTTVFHFPKDDEMRALWLKSIARANFTPSKHAVVCIKHFEDDCVITHDVLPRPEGDILIKRGTPKLKEDAYPTIFEGYPKYLIESKMTKRTMTGERFETVERNDNDINSRIEEDSSKDLEIPFIDIKTSHSSLIAMSEAEKEKEISCFAVDGVVAEMVIEVEDNQKSGSEDFKDVSSSPEKIILSDKPDKDSEIDKTDEIILSDSSMTDSLSEKTKTDIQDNSGVDTCNDSLDKDAHIDTLNESSLSEKPNIESDEREDKSDERDIEIDEKDSKIDELDNNSSGVQNDDSTLKEKEENNEVEVPEKDSQSEENDEIFSDDEIQEQDGKDQSIKYDKKARIEKKESVEKQNVELDSEIREDKENSNMKIEKKEKVKNETSARKKNDGYTKRKRKRRSINASENKDQNQPRYPGRKRIANARYISEEMITPKIKKYESNNSVDNPEGKRRKLDSDAKGKEDEKVTPSQKLQKKAVQNKRSKASINDESIDAKDASKNFTSKSIKAEIVESETEKSLKKQDVLRKLPFRKNRDAPDVPDLKPKVFWWNGVGQGQGLKLEDIPEVRDRIERARSSIRALYRIIFYQWPANGRDFVKELLDFNGFPFDETSFEFTKRQSLMKIMLDTVLGNICDILDLRRGEKQTMINNILNFLLRPQGKIDPATDPAFQPVVVLERIVLDDQFFSETSASAVKKRNFRSSKSNKDNNVSSSLTPVRNTRMSGYSKDIVKSTDIRKSAEKSKDDVKAEKSKISVLEEAVRKRRGRPPATETKTNISISKDVKVCLSRITDVKMGPSLKENKVKIEDKKIKRSSQTVKDEKPTHITIVKKPVQGRFKRKKKMTRNVLKKKKTVEKKMSENESNYNSDEYEIEMTVDSGPDIDEDETKDLQPLAEEKNEKITVKKSKMVPVSSGNMSDSSETESADETKLVAGMQKSKQFPESGKGKPLKQFPIISESIQKANFSALQRLHILLFGASDKAENLKGNILGFAGFSFQEGSVEWKQKHFLLSLLAQNNLREYLNLLCIKQSDDDQPTMINKLMRFLAVPSEESLENQIQTIETEVVSSVLINKSPPATLAKGKAETKKKSKKKEVKKGPGPRRKILMSEAEAKRMEASFAREQRAIARDNKTPTLTIGSQNVNAVKASTPVIQPQIQPLIKPKKPPVTDPNQLNALLQTVYKRRALKAAGAVVSTPNKGERTKLGDIENIKFLIVTSNLSDLEMLHHLIFMMDASKSRLRKNILDFDGFGFNEDSPKYKERINLLNSWGYDASKRVSFLLGLCTLQTSIPQQDLNELIMYFLMSPCRTKHVVPITEMPPSDEPNIIVNLEKPLYHQNLSQRSSPVGKKSNKRLVTEPGIQTSTPVPKIVPQKARKSFPSTSKVGSKVVTPRKILLPPAQSPILNITSHGNKPQTVSLMNSIPAIPAHSLSKASANSVTGGVTLLNTTSGIAVLNTPKSPVNSLVKVPLLSPGSKVQVVNKGSKMTVLDTAVKNPGNTVTNIPGQALQNQVFIPQIANKSGIQTQQSLSQVPQIPTSKMPVNALGGGIVASPQEFLVQQQTPDGKQKTFKLIRLLPNHPLASVVSKPPVQQTVAPSQIQPQYILANPSMTGNAPTGFVIMKNNSGLPSTVQNLQSIFHSPPVKSTLPTSKISSPVAPSLLQTNVKTVKEVTVPGEVSAGIPANSKDNEVELINPEEDPPTDEELFSRIQDIILSANFENITLRMVIEKVAAQFPNHDLTHRHNYMKECVKKIIMGT